MDRYDLPDMKKVWTKEIWGTDDGTDKGKSLHVEAAVCLNDGVVVIATSHDHSTVYAMQLRPKMAYCWIAEKLRLEILEREISEKVILFSDSPCQKTTQLLLAIM